MVGEIYHSCRILCVFYWLFVPRFPSLVNSLDRTYSHKSSCWKSSCSNPWFHVKRSSYKKYKYNWTFVLELFLNNKLLVVPFQSIFCWISLVEWNFHYVICAKGGHIQRGFVTKRVMHHWKKWEFLMKMTLNWTMFKITYQNLNCSWDSGQNILTKGRSSVQFMAILKWNSQFLQQPLTHFVTKLFNCTLHHVLYAVKKKFRATTQLKNLHWSVFFFQCRGIMDIDCFQC